MPHINISDIKFIINIKLFATSGGDELRPIFWIRNFVYFCWPIRRRKTGVIRRVGANPAIWKNSAKVYNASFNGAILWIFTVGITRFMNEKKHFDCQFWQFSRILFRDRKSDLWFIMKIVFLRTSLIWGLQTRVNRPGRSKESNFSIW